MRAVVVGIVLLTSWAAPSLAFAQRFPFERTLQVSNAVKLDAATVRGKIEIRAGAPGRVVVSGTATVRIGYDVPANAADLARQVAASPPIEQSGDLIRLRIPADGAVQRAVTIAYRVEVPPDTEVQTSSESGETTVHGIAAPVNVRTQSGAITLGHIAGAVLVVTGSGAVVAEDIGGDVSITTTSSSFRGAGIGAALRVRTQSGDVNAALHGGGDVEVQTGSSAIRLTGLGGALTAKTQSGRVTIQGTPIRDWSVTTGSSGIDVTLKPDSGFSLEAVSRSGAVVLEGIQLEGSAQKRTASGTVRGGGPRVHFDTRSGTIRIRLGGP